MNYNKIKLLFEDIYNLTKELMQIKLTINKNLLTFNKLKSDTESILISEINNETKKLNKINLLNNNKIYFDNNDFKINFNNDDLITNINQFTLNYNRQYLFSSINNTKTIKDYERSFDLTTNTLKIKLETKQVINFLQYAFLDIDNTPILPKQIYYNDISNNNLLLDPWQTKLKKDIINDEFINTFIIDPKDVIELYFVFDDQVNFKDSKLYLGCNEYAKGSSLIYKFPIKDLNGFLLYKDTFERYIGLKFEYSLDNKNFSELNFENDIARIVFNEQKQIESLYIKILRDNVKYNNTDDKIINKQMILKSSDCKLSDINYSAPERNFNLIVDNQFYFLLKDKLPDLFNKRIDGLIEIKSEWIKQISEINPLQKLSLENSNDLKIFDADNYPIFYLDNSNVLWLPYCFGKYEYNFIYLKEEKTETFKEENYTPICFNFSLNLI